MTTIRTLGAFTAAAIAAIAFGSAANATTAFNQSLVSPGFYAGSGNPNAGFTVDTTSGVEIGLGLHYRYGANVSPSPTSGSVYNVQTGYYGSGWCGGICSLWNIDFSINLRADGPTANSNVLADFVPTLEVTKVGGATVSMNLLDAFPDSSGWNGSENTAYDPSGLAGPSTDNTSTDWGVQNSENLAFSQFSGLAFNPAENASYLVTLFLAPSSSASSAVAAQQVSIQINATPIPASLPLFAGGLGVMGLIFGRKKRKNAAKAAA